MSIPTRNIASPGIGGVPTSPIPVREEKVGTLAGEHVVREMHTNTLPTPQKVESETIVRVSQEHITAGASPVEEKEDERHIEREEKRTPSEEHVEGVRQSVIHAPPPHVEAAQEDITTRIQLKEALAQAYVDANNPAEAFRIRAEIAKTSFPPDHPLADMASTIAQKSAQSPLPRMGAHVESLDTGTIKGQSIHCSRRTLAQGASAPNPQDCFCFDFHLTHVARELLAKNLSAIQSDLTSFQQVSQHAITITEIPVFGIRSYDQATDRYTIDGELQLNQHYGPTGDPKTACLEINIQDVGKIIIHEDKEQHSFYNQVEIQLDATRSQGPDGLKKLHTILALLGLGATLCPSRPEDEKRMKIFTLLHAFFPSISYRMERDLANYQLSVAELRKKIHDEHPECSVILQKYLDDHPELLVKTELYSGKHTYNITDLGEEIRKHAFGLFVGIAESACHSIGWETNKEAAKREFQPIAERFVKRIKQGVAVMSNLESIFRQGNISSGTSPTDDIDAGGFDSAFTRLYPKTLAGESRVTLSSFPFCDDGIRLIVDADCMGLSGTYAHAFDSYGTRKAKGNPNYSERRGLVEHAEYLGTEAQTHYSFVDSNEVMIKDVLPSRFMRKIVVKREAMKEILIQSMRDNDLIKQKTIDGKTVEYLVTPGFEIPLEEFICVGNTCTSEMWQTKK